MSRPHLAYVPQVRTAVVVDDEILRHGLVHVLSQVEGVDCVGDRCDAEGLAERTRALQPDVVLVGADRVEHLSAALSNLDYTPKVIAIVDPGAGSADIMALIRAGVDAVVDRRSSSAEVQRIVRQVVNGQHVLDAYSAHTLVLEIRAESCDTEHAASPALTLRENEVLTLLTEGLDNRAIAARLFISQATVKFHLRNVMSKYGVHRRTALVSAALRDTRSQTVRV
jgi:DNA-binding NarL/FixJ family response regulator